jgi:hypothetical protein
MPSDDSRFQGGAGDTITLSIAGVGIWTSTLATSLNRLSGRDQTEVLDACLHRTMDWFLEAYGPLRFTRYAEVYLGYSAANETYKNKARKARRYADAALPNVWNGETREAFKQARFESRAAGGRTSGQIRGRIVVALPGYVNQQRSQLTNKTLRKIAPTEGDKIARRFFEEIIAANSRLTFTTATRDGEIVPRASLNRADTMGNRGTIVMQRPSAAAGMEVRSA